MSTSTVRPNVSVSFLCHTGSDVRQRTGRWSVCRHRYIPKGRGVEKQEAEKLGAVTFRVGPY